LKPRRNFHAACTAQSTGFNKPDFTLVSGHEYFRGIFQLGTWYFYFANNPKYGSSLYDKRGIEQTVNGLNADFL